VRAALAASAAERLGEVRVLRLLDIELEERTPLSPQPAGPLGGEIIWVWVEMPSPGRAVIEVRRVERPLVRRTLNVDGMSPDVAARLVAITASEMVRVQARAPRAKEARKTAPEPAGSRNEGAHALAAVAVSAAFSALVLPTAAPGLLFGPQLGLAHRRGPTEQVLYGRWLTSPFGDTEARWLEVGAGIGMRLALPDPDWRLHFGAAAGAAQLDFPGAETVDGTPGRHGWSARGTALLGVETRVSRAGWLGLDVEPGAVLHALEATDAAGASRTVGGFALGLTLGLTADVAAGAGGEPSHKRPPPDNGALASQTAGHAP
jgi:hypothetical protein